MVNLKSLIPLGGITLLLLAPAKAEANPEVTFGEVPDLSIHEFPLEPFGVAQTTAPIASPITSLREDPYAGADNTLSTAAPLQTPGTWTIAPSVLNDEALTAQTSEASPANDIPLNEAPVADETLTSPLEATPTTTPDPAATASVWHFSFEPFIVLPLNTNIGSTTQDVGIDIDISLGDVASSFSRLNFAFLGKFEAWYENQGVVLNTEYFAVGGGQVRDFRVPPRLQGVLPGTLTADFSADLLKADLMYAYRFSDPPAGGYGRGFTEFDLPPISFDLMGGARFYWLAQEATLTSGLGGSISQSTSNVIVEPVIRGRLRWNTSDYLALKLDTNVSGFGFGDAFTFSWSALTALEWMFSGNTSFSAGYQINHVNFDRNGGADNINLTSHGPYLSFLFRF
jgi:hypothetical protein